MEEVLRAVRLWRVCLGRCGSTRQRGWGGGCRGRGHREGAHVVAAGWRGQRRAGEEFALERRRDFLEEAAWVALVVMILEAGVVIGEEADASGRRGQSCLYELM